MKQIALPSSSINEVRVLKRKLVNQSTATTLWKRTNGPIGAFKAELTKDLLVKQDRRCGYCGSRLFEEYPHRDHIAPKKPYFHWTFWPGNLVLACYACNTDKKKAADTVRAVGRTYRRTEFTIIHPYYDDPKAHLNFIGHRGGILVNAKNGSIKGEETIKLFDLMSPDRVKQRAKDALFDHDVAHLHGRWKRLFEQFVFSPLPAARALKMKR